MRQDLTRSQIEVGNLRRRLRNEQKKSKAEEMSNQKYRLEVRSLSDQLKQTRSEFDKEMHRVVKKHKMEMEKAEYYRENFLKHKDELKRRQEELDREFRKLEQAKQSLEHMKRSRKSRSLSPSIKRFRGRDGAFHDHRSPPPPPKLTSEVRPKTSLERPSAYYEEKKPRAIYERLGDYSDKSFPKETNGRERTSYPSDAVGVQKSSWSHSAAEPWKKTSNTATFLKPYMERFDTSHQEFQVPPSSYYSQGTLDYSKHNHFDIARKY
ncbi:hypothetical protein WA026_010733 [Henosepilachna vigintioctopunctata]|uniref:Uncharacterized protein n=1 Tax=Henosepilachna vigintioctopunctata TaxID=420089 RepID=A0AAW1UZ30_9CUCU